MKRDPYSWEDTASWSSVPGEPVYEYHEPGDLPGDVVTIRRTRSQILAEYGPHWRQRMVDVGRTHQISDDRCIEDWCAAHWATEVKP